MEKREPKARTIVAPEVGICGRRPARYRIVVGKWLSPDWSDRLAGMEITPGEEDPSQATITRLEGIIQDQAQLLGILNTLYDLHFPLLKVEFLEEEPGRGDTGGNA